MDYSFDRHDIKTAPQEMQDLFAYWDGLRGKRKAPTLKEFDLLKIPSRILPNIIVFDYLADEDNFKYRFFGTELAQRMGQDLTGLSPLDNKIPSLGQAILKEYRKYVKRGGPEYLTFGASNGLGADELHKVLRLPLSDNDETVSGIVVIFIASKDDDEFREYFGEY